MHNWKVVLGIMTCNVVLMSASYTMLIPFLPLYLLNELGASPESLNMWTGAIFAVSFGVCAIMAPIWGRLSDKKGKKLMLIRAASLIALTYLLGGLVQTPFQLLLVRILQGFAAGLWPASLAIMSAYSPKNKIGICMGVMQSANICGGILGPLMGGLLADEFGIRISFFIASAALAVITVITIFLIKEPPKTEDQNATQAANITYKGLLTREGIGLILIAACLTNMVILLLQPIMTLYIGELLGSSENLLSISGVVFSLSGISGAIAAPIWGRQGQSKGFYKTMVLSLSAAGILIAAQFLPSSLIPFAILQFCVGLGFSGIFPSANAMLINLTSPLERGSAFGMLFSAQQIGGAIGPLLGGLIATWINLSFIFLLSGSILICIALFVFLKAPAILKTGQNQVNARPSRDAIDDIKRQMAEEIAREMELNSLQQKLEDSKVKLQQAEALEHLHQHQKELESEHAKLAKEQQQQQQNTMFNQKLNDPEPSALQQTAASKLPSSLQQATASSISSTTINLPDVDAAPSDNTNTTDTATQIHPQQGLEATVEKIFEQTLLDNDSSSEHGLDTQSHTSGSAV